MASVQLQPFSKDDGISITRYIPQVVVNLDDILISGATLQQHMNILEVASYKKQA